MIARKSSCLSSIPGPIPAVAERRHLARTRGGHHQACGPGAVPQTGLAASQVCALHRVDHQVWQWGKRAVYGAWSCNDSFLSIFQVI